MDVRRVDGEVTSELRRSVLRPGWAAGTPMAGHDNPRALHVAALDDDGTARCACVVSPQPHPDRPDKSGTWQLRGMATAEPVRGHGLGALVLAAAVEEVRTRGGRLIWCNAREPAIAFYARHGFRPNGAIYLDAETGVRHQRMERELIDDAASSTR